MEHREGEIHSFFMTANHVLHSILSLFYSVEYLFSGFIISDQIFAKDYQQQPISAFLLLLLFARFQRYLIMRWSMIREREREIRWCEIDCTSSSFHSIREEKNCFYSFSFGISLFKG